MFLRRGVFEDILSNYLAKSLCDFENNQAKKELYMIIVQSIEVIINCTIFPHNDTNVDNLTMLISSGRIVVCGSKRGFGYETTKSLSCIFQIEMYRLFIRIIRISMTKAVIIL